MPRPRSLTTDDLAAAALAVIDRDGLDGLTMRAVAQELHMATMALYRYVPDRNRLELLVADRALNPIDISLPPGLDWRERVTTLLDRVRAVVSAHPAALPLTLRHRQDSAATMRWIEAMLTVLSEAGFAGAELVIAQRTLVAFLVGHLENQHYASIGGPGTSALAQAPADAYPLMSRTAALARELPPDEEFRRGLAVVLCGLEASRK